MAGSPNSDLALRRRQERLRHSFRPDTVRLLFVGESPPASGRFFYQRDSGLYRAMRDAFQIADPSIADENFLTVFQDAGCYLIDLCPEPVDDWDRLLRRAACRDSEPSLSKEMRQLQPVMIATLLRSIEGNVARAAQTSKGHSPFIHLPYPGRWSRHRDVFVDLVVPVVRRLLGS